MSEPSVRVEHVWKQYTIRHQMGNTGLSFKDILYYPIRAMKERLAAPDKKVNEQFWALEDVSFNIDQGESVGIIGRNGAGKSTLLKILSRITRPTKGRVLMYEKVNSLLEVGTGFNTELSGRDNIYLNGTFLGMGQEEITRKFEEIVDFSEIRQFIDTPVKYYSSGMFLRLAFSIAANLTPELLLLDEVLAVGDGAFRQKSQAKMKELIHSGATIILVSHSEQSIQEVCERVIWLEKGRLVEDGPTSVVLGKYIKSLAV
ncbi:MAG TPA: ABC transporter ATP-binding protein [Bellilinea sp.]|nr:ABC transporter ATP-binding protein [Bellilinea sp.]